MKPKITAEHILGTIEDFRLDPGSLAIIARVSADGKQQCLGLTYFLYSLEQELGEPLGLAFDVIYPHGSAIILGIALANLTSLKTIYDNLYTLGFDPAKSQAVFHGIKACKSSGSIGTVSYDKFQIDKLSYFSDSVFGFIPMGSLSRCIHISQNVVPHPMHKSVNEIITKMIEQNDEKNERITNESNQATRLSTIGMQDTMDLLNQYSSKELPDNTHSEFLSIIDELQQPRVLILEVAAKMTTKKSFSVVLVPIPERRNGKEVFTLKFIINCPYTAQPFVYGSKDQKTSESQIMKEITPNLKEINTAICKLLNTNIQYLLDT
jgi:hypothetical protein